MEMCGGNERLAIQFVVEVGVPVLMAQYQAQPPPPPPPPAEAAEAAEAPVEDAQRQGGEEEVVRVVNVTSVSPMQGAAAVTTRSAVDVFTPLRYDDDDDDNDDNDDEDDNNDDEGEDIEDGDNDEEDDNLPSSPAMWNVEQPTRSLATRLAEVATPERVARVRKLRRLLVEGSPSRAMKGKGGGRMFVLETSHAALEGEAVEEGVIDGYVSETRVLSTVQLMNMSLTSLAYKSVALYPDDARAVGGILSPASVAMARIGPIRGYWAFFCSLAELNFVWRKAVDAITYRGSLPGPAVLLSSTVFCDPKAHTFAILVPVPSSAKVGRMAALGQALLALVPGKEDTVYFRTATCQSRAATARLFRLFRVEEEEHVIKAGYKVVLEEVEAQQSAEPAVEEMGARGGGVKRRFERAIAEETGKRRKAVLYSIDREGGKPWVRVDADAAAAPEPSVSGVPPPSSAMFEVAFSE